MRLSIRSRARPLAAALALLAAAVAGQAHAQDVYIHIPVELGNAGIRKTLPFNEPFLLVGPAAAQLKQVDARVLLVDRRGRYLLFDSIHAAERDTGAIRSEEACARALSHGTTQSWRRSTRLTTDSFTVFLPTGLAANQRYAFCVRARSAIDSTRLAAFQARAFQILDDAFEHLPAIEKGHLPNAQNAALRQSLNAALPREPGDSVEAHGIFDIHDPHPDVDQIVFTSNVFQAQSDRASAASTWEKRANLAKGRLLDLRGRTLAMIASGLPANAKIPGLSAAQVETALGTARMLAVPDSSLLLFAGYGSAVIDGGTATAADPTGPTAATDSADVALRLARLDSTYLNLSQLRALLTAVETSGSLPKQLHVNANDVSIVRRNLDLARAIVDMLRGDAVRWIQDDAQRRRLLLTAARSLRLTAEDTVALLATSIAEFETRAKQVVTADVGVAYLPFIHEVAPYFGANFYLAALNKRVPMGLVGGNELSRWSFTLGVTANSIA
ncbi:MAG: hypothetical protein JO306_17225, partial [Gemmatimonadetes bacterium]|nr:hypothetical protein [Gemmatimonadota bacterium]